MSNTEHPYTHVITIIVTLLSLITVNSLDLSDESIRIADDGVVEFRVGVILIDGHGAPYDRIRSGPAIDMAFEMVNREILNSSYRLVKVDRKYGPKCDANVAPGVAAEMFYEEHVIALLGPGCTYALDPVGRLASFWNLPVITGVGDSRRFRDKSDYQTLTRMSYCQCRMRMVFDTVLDEFYWTDIAIIIDRDDLHSTVLGETLDDGFRTRARFPYIITYYGTSNPDFTKLLQEASDHARVIILCAQGEVVRRLMITAFEMGFINGDYVFMDVELFPFHGDYWGNHHWRGGYDDDWKARKAYEALIRFSLILPDGPSLPAFNVEAKMRSQRDYNYTYREDEDINFFVGAYHDGLQVFAIGLNETLEMDGDIHDGRTMSHLMWNRKFVGITDDIYIDTNGDRDTTYIIMDLNPDTGEFETVAHYWGNKPGYNPVAGKSMHWPGGRTTPTPNTPRCWFRHDNPACIEPEPMSTSMLIMIVLLCSTVVTGLIAFLVYRKHKLESAIRDTTWVINSEELQELKGNKLTSSIRMSMANSEISLRSGKKSIADNQVFTDIANYKGEQVAMRSLKCKSVELKRSLLVEVSKRRALHHDNIARFVGAVLEPPKMLVLHEYCPKGSLQDLLANDSITLDKVFKMSLIQDLVMGMTYIHSSAVQSHGKLQSSNCAIDSRFVLKITDFGLPTLYAVDPTQDTNTFINYTKLFYHAPEHLRTKMPECGSPRGDVYSFGIILEEVILRAGPYDEASVTMTAENIVEQVRKGMDPPFRPIIKQSMCTPELKALMTSCLLENPDSRPDFNAIRGELKKMNRGVETNIMDNLLKRMEQYANNLEDIVADRTQLLLLEQKKTEQLLLQILPKSIAEQLKSGKSVEPETFDHVTIYFSDVVGFTTLSAASTPLQIVNMLNDLYTCFDSILGEFDVYKVETIGDAYMITSGLPEKNGNLHAREIARVSLKLLNAIRKFRVRHKPEEELRLRIGLHTGSVVAGVVGLKMPRYCLFGDTVNTASRMESNGLPLRIHMSDSTTEVLREIGGFQIEERGQIEVKGKGQMTTYWLNGESK